MTMAMRTSEFRQYLKHPVKPSEFARSEAKRIQREARMSTAVQKAPLKLTREQREERERLAASVEGMVIKYSHERRRFIRGMDFADIKAQARIGVAVALNLWEPSRGVKFSTYAARCILTELDRLKKYGEAKSRSSGIAVDGLCPTMLADIAPDDSSGPAAQLIARENYNRLRWTIDRMPDPVTKQALRLILGIGRRPHTIKEAAKAMGYSGERIRQLVGPAIERLTAKFSEEEGN